MEKKKYIICDSARANWGKTETLQTLITLLSKIYKPLDIQTEGKDTYAVFRLENGKIVFVSTLGDPGSGYMSWWHIGMNLNPDIFVCACRTSGETYNNLLNISKAHEYEVVWFKNFHFENYALTKTVAHTSVQNLEVKCLYEVIVSL